jgi:hypothetical protein
LTKKINSNLRQNIENMIKMKKMPPAKLTKPETTIQTFARSEVV